MSKYAIRHDKTETKSRLLRDGKFALGLTLGSLTTVLIFVAHEFFRGAQHHSEYLVDAPLIVSFLVAIGSIYISANALLEQRTMREASTDPVLIAHLGQREDARELITFKVSNVGAGAALNVQLEVDRPDDDADDWGKRNFLENIFLPRRPLAVVLQGDSIEFNLALGWHLLGQDSIKHIDRDLPRNALPPFAARLTYEDIAGGQYNAEFTIDANELRGLGAHKTPQMRMVAALEAIAKRK